MLQLTRSLLRSAKAVFPEHSPRALLNRARFVRAGLAHRALVEQIALAPPATAIHSLYTQRPDILGVLIWPYICAAWGPEERLERVINHYAVIDTLGSPFPFSIDDRLVLADLGDMHPDLRLVLDQPRWFKREGGLTLNLFIDQFRAYSIAYSYNTQPDGSRAIFIGGLQGRSNEGSVEVYRDLTKSLHAMRPRDFLIHALQTLARATDTQHLYAVTDAQRHHRHPYFGGKEIIGDYDPMWEDRAATRINDHFYQLPLIPERRDIDEIKSKKKTLYRRRYEFLDTFDARLPENLASCTPVRFVDL